MDFGLFPSPWTLKDTLTHCAGALGIVAAIVAGWLDVRGSKLMDVQNEPEPAYPGLMDPERQEKLAVLRADRRAVVSRGAALRRVSQKTYIVAVVEGFVASEPWLAIIGGVVLIAAIWYAAAALLQERSTTERRSEILRLYREMHAHSTAMPFMSDTTIAAEIERTYAIPADELDRTTNNMNLALVIQRDKHRQYVAASRAHAAMREKPGAPEGQAPPPPHDDPAPGSK